MQCCFRPGSITTRRQTEDRPAAWRVVVLTGLQIPAVLGCPIEIAPFVENYPARGVPSIVACEGVEHRLRPLPTSTSHQFENCALHVAVVARHSCPVQISRLIEDQTAVGFASVVAASKGIKRGLRPSFG